MGLKVIIGSTSTPQIHSMCIPHRRNNSHMILCLKMEDVCLSDTTTHTTADSQGGLEKPVFQETWVGPRPTAASLQSFYFYKFSIGGLVTRQTNNGPSRLFFFFFFELYTVHF